MKQHILFALGASLVLFLLCCIAMPLKQAIDSLFIVLSFAALLLIGYAWYRHHEPEE